MAAAEAPKIQVTQITNLEQLLKEINEAKMEKVGITNTVTVS